MITKYEEEWSDINNLLSSLRASRVVELVRAFYAPYRNTAPEELLKQQIDKVQQHLDNASS